MTSEVTLQHSVCKFQTIGHLQRLLLGVNFILIFFRFSEVLQVNQFSNRINHSVKITLPAIQQQSTIINSRICFACNPKGAWTTSLGRIISTAMQAVTF
jgi:hypothetical protein